MNFKILLIAIVVSNFCYSQTIPNNWCGVNPSRKELTKYSETINRLYATRAMEIQPTCLNKKFSIHVHIIGENDSTGFKDGNLVVSNIDSLNVYFSPICLTFEVCEIEYIKNSLFYNLQDTDYVNIQELYSDSGVINMFFINSFAGSTEVGMASLPTGVDDGLFAISDNDPKTIIHEMGHFLGLLHTHDTGFGAELVNGSNCITAGDQLCDTEASPNLLGLVTPACNYSFNLMDSNGDHYTPSLFNHMSYSHNNCRTQFTPQQFKVMIYTILNLRTNLH